MSVSVKLKINIVRVVAGAWSILKTGSVTAMNNAKKLLRL